MPVSQYSVMLSRTSFSGEVACGVPVAGVTQYGRGDRRGRLAPAVPVVQQPGGQAGGRIRQPVQRLRACPHQGCVGAPPGIQDGQLLVRMLFVGWQSGGRRVAALERLGQAGRDGGREVDVNAEQLRGFLLAHHVRDRPAPVAALRREPRVAQAFHEHDPGAGDAGGVPAGLPRLAGVPVARQRGDHQVERVRGGRAVGGGIGERADDLQLLDDRAGPAVRDDERRLSACGERTWMKWMSSPSISVMKWGKAFSVASHRRQS